ncbi:hypothetical protein P3X46_015875 [Hevea brasiliensis]|uniref:Uncharacterized protein n=1 Tax=Hevea brasiliensis TaxID=3981 RepID=A0ABQ9LXG5_HEVBR|nr:uncharacterized protein LOC110663895 isoform X3 [Hevea brasiliensis]KAJ9172661.1 hypothetical protein P3X46_015875 [Hevea brasiliensis]
MKEDYKIEEKKQAAADVLFQYSKLVMTCIGNQVRPCDLRLHLMKEMSGLPTSLKRELPQTAASPDAMGESSSSGTARLDKAESFRAL